MKRTLNIFSALAVIGTVLISCSMAGEALVLAGATPGAVVTALMGLATGSAWSQVFSQKDWEAERAMVWLLCSFVFFLLSYLFSHWQIWLDTTLMFQ
jgi:putative Ca2+/H+ antiporter (TMEM165/GDT1 family)